MLLQFYSESINTLYKNISFATKMKRNHDILI